MDATGRDNVTVSFDVEDIDGSVDNALQQVACNIALVAGNYTMSAAFITDATAGPYQGKVTHVTATLRSWANKSDLQIRVITNDAAGNDEWVGIDNIQVTSTVVHAPVFGQASYSFGIAEDAANGATRSGW